MYQQDDYYYKGTPEAEMENDTVYQPYKKVYYSDVVGSPILDAVTGANIHLK